MLKKRLSIQFGLLLCLIFLIGCGSFRSVERGEDQSYLTPIPENTLLAYRAGTPIANKLQAVIAARALLSTSRMEDLQTPVVLSVERMSMAEAVKQTTRPGVENFADLPDSTPVWLVIFEGEWRLNPPAPAQTVTPLPTFHGCQYVWIAEDASGYSATGNIDCPNLEAPPQ